MDIGRAQDLLIQDQHAAQQRRRRGQICNAITLQDGKAELCGRILLDRNDRRSDRQRAKITNKAVTPAGISRRPENIVTPKIESVDDIRPDRRQKIDGDAAALGLAR